jgi:serine phosphatase RsbU (regulator of sigma subunit)
VGLFSNPSFPLARVPLPPSFTLVLVSDGVLELLPMHSLAEKQAALLERVRPGIGIDRFVDSLGVEKAERLPDDIAVLMIQRPSHVER